jgi:hypothetical protein
MGGKSVTHRQDPWPVVRELRVSQPPSPSARDMDSAISGSRPRFSYSSYGLADILQHIAEVSHRGFQLMVVEFSDVVTPEVVPVFCTGR